MTGSLSVPTNGLNGTMITTLTTLPRNPIPTTGYYWIALSMQSNNPTYQGSINNYPVNFARPGLRVENFAYGTGGPATATPAPFSGGIPYLALLEQ